MIRRLRVAWPDPRPFADRDDRPIRWLVVSDEEDRALGFEINRAALEPIDAVLGAGDLEPEYLGFLGDAFGVAVAYVRGNHDRGGRWEQSVATLAPEPLRTGSIGSVSGIAVLALEWPGLRHADRKRHDGSGWVDVVRIAARLVGRRMVGRGAPVVILSHAPPRGVGDRAVDAYHVGFAAYRWLLDRLRPPLWLHGHVPPASVEGWRSDHRGTLVVNVTGAVLVELTRPGRDPAGTP